MPTVLIVDDDKYTQTVLHNAFSQDAWFTDFDVRTITADNGEDGLVAFRDHQPEIVATDLLMPRMDGFSLCRAIRAEPRGDQVHLIAMSGVYRDASIAKQVQEEFGAEFFAKPYQLRDMKRYIATLLRDDSGIPEAREESKARISLADLAERTGELAERPVPALLFDFREAEANGRLTLQRGRVTKTIELIVGHPLVVTSSARDDALGPFLLSVGALTEVNLQRAVSRAAKKKQKISDALIALGIVTPEQMVSYLTMHTCTKLVHSLRWPEGTWRFRPRDQSPSGPWGNPIEMEPLILQGLRHTASFDSIPERVAAVEHAALRLTERGERLLPTVHQCLSSKLVDEWTDRTTVSDLLAAGVERNELYTTLEALLYCEAVTVCDPSSWVAGSETDQRARDHGDFSIEELSEHSQSQRVGRDQDDGSRELYSMLFDDPGIAVPLPGPELPIELPDDDLDQQPPDSGIIDVSDIRRSVQAMAESESNHARRVVLKEYLRIQGLDYYEMLGLAPDAPQRDIESAVRKRSARFALEAFARYDLGRDYAKLEEIHGAYGRAQQILTDAQERAAYDQSLSGGDLVETEPVIEAEDAFFAGQKLLREGKFDGAIEHLERAVAASPDEADYHAALGWAHYLRGNRTPRAADMARPHLNQGLAINPDHALSHEYKGLISAALGNDDEEAVFHLERALEADPSRTEALQALEGIWRQRGAFRPLERQYRKLIYRIAREASSLEAELWVKLAELCRTELDDPVNARIAYAYAARLGADNPQVQEALSETDADDPKRFAERGEMLRRQWHRDPGNAQPGIQLMDGALRAGRPDAAFMAASALVARGLANSRARELYERYRPRFLIRAQRQLNAQLWEQLRHPYDSAELSALFSLIAIAVEQTFPLELDDLEVDEGMEVEEGDLPGTFVRVRAYVAQMLGVNVPRVFVRPDFGHQIHVGALDTPILLAGEEALVSPERLELGFRLGRAMTYLLPGRTIAGSRPARLLKAAVLALFADVHPQANIVDSQESQVAQLQSSLRSNLRLLSPHALDQAHGIVAHITSTNQSLNLSRWVRAMGRTADRVGLLLCGDLPAAVRFARGSGRTSGSDELIDFAVSAEFLRLRSQIGLSIDV